MVRTHRGWMSDLYSLIGQNPSNSTEAAIGSTYTVDRFASQLRTALVEAGLPDIHLDCEPGRVLISDAMLLVSAIQAVKHYANHRWLVLDGGLNLLPTAALGESRRVRFISSPVPEGAPVTMASSYSLGGPLCYEGDVLQRDVPVPAGLAVGSYVCLSDVGAYSVSRSTSFNQPRAAVVMLDGQSSRLVWRRETYSDIFQFHL
jgi:diaminopimelate decarboxylase